MTPAGFPRPARILGLDFSGAVNAGRKIWLTGGQVAGDALHVTQCRPAETLPGAAARRELCLPALVAYLRRQGFFAAGLDFPFGLHRDLVSESSFAEFLAAFPARYRTPEAFRAACSAAGSERALRRLCDREARTPFAAHNLRLYRQTYHGIVSVLLPMVRDHGARVLPLHAPAGKRPWLLETCPASALKRRRMRVPYKGRGPPHRGAGEAILGMLLGEGIVLDAPDLRQVIVDDADGDALDSLLCAWITHCAVGCRDTLLPPLQPEHRVEGYVYC